MQKLLIGVFFICFILIGCQKANEAPKSETPTTQGTTNKYPGWETTGAVETTASGLKYIDLVAGSGESPTPGQEVTVHYSGYLTNGTKFESSVDQNAALAFQTGVDEVIKGLDEGVMSMKVGGKRKLIIPPQLGYDKQGTGPIPPNAELIFDVELLGVK